MKIQNCYSTWPKGTRFCMFFSDRSQMTDIHPAYYVAFRHLQCRKGFHEKEVEAQFGNGTL